MLPRPLFGSESFLTFLVLSFFLGGTALRMIGLDAPLSSDELASTSIWAQMPYTKIPVNYQYPNNHIFHTLLVSLILKSFGLNHVLLRLPVFICGVASLVLIYFTALRATRNKLVAAGALTLLCFADSPVFNSTNARGYALVMIFAQLAVHQLILLLSLDKRRDFEAAIDRFWVWRILLLGGLLIFGTWTVPTFVFFEGSLAVILAGFWFNGDEWIRRRVVHFLGMILLAGGAFSLQYYILIPQDMLQQAQANGAVIEGSRFLPVLLDEWTNPWSAFQYGMFFFVMYGFWKLNVDNPRMGFFFSGLLLFPLILAKIALAAGYISGWPYPRVFFYLQPFFFILCSLGFYHCLSVILKLSGCICSIATSSGVNFVAAVCFIIISLTGAMSWYDNLYMQRIHRAPFDRVKIFLDQLGPRDLILSSKKSHVWFYLYGASAMRDRVETILNEGKIDSVFFIEFRMGNESDMPVIKEKGVEGFSLKQYSHVPFDGGTSSDPMIPRSHMELAGDFGPIKIYRVEGNRLKKIIRLQTRKDMDDWEIPLNGSKGLEVSNLSNQQIQLSFNRSFIIIEKNPELDQNATFSIDIHLLKMSNPSGAFIYYSNGSLKNGNVRFCETWFLNDWVMDHPYGPAVWNRPWTTKLFLSYPNNSRHVLGAQADNSGQTGFIFGALGYRITF